MNINGIFNGYFDRFSLWSIEKVSILVNMRR